MLAVLLCATPGAAAGPAPPAVADPSSAAQAPPKQVRITLGTVDPTVLSPGAPLILTGSVTNLSRSPVSAPHVHLQVATRTINTRAAAEEWNDPSENAELRPLATAAVPGGTLAAGASRPFSVEVPEKSLGYSYRSTTLGLRLSLTAGKALTPAGERGRLQTTVPWVDGDVSKPLQLGVVVPLTLPGDGNLFSKDPSVRLRAWQRAIGPGSLVRRSLAAMRQLPVTWLVDPTMLEPPGPVTGDLGRAATQPTPTPAPSPSSSSPPSPPPPTSGTSSPSASSTTPGSDDAEPTSTPTSTPSSTAPASSGDAAQPSSPSNTSGSPSPTPTPTPEPEPQPTNSVSALVASLRAELTRARTTQPIWFLPYSDPDLLQVQRSAGTEATRPYLRRPLSPQLRRLGTTVPLWTAENPAPDELTRLTDQWRTTRGVRPPALLSTHQLDGRLRSTTSNAGRRLADGTSVLAYDELLGFTLGAAGGSTGSRTQRALADTLAMHQQRPEVARTVLAVLPRSQRAAPEQTSAVLQALQAAPWIRPVSTTNLLRQAAQAPPSERVPADRREPLVPMPPPALDVTDVQRLADDRRLAGDISGMLVDSGDLASLWSNALTDLASTRWRGRSTVTTSLGTRVHTTLEDITQGVTVRPSQVNFFTEGADLSVTVVNSLPRGVEDVQLALHPRRYLLRVVREPEPLAVAPNSRTAVRVPVEALAAGTVLVDAVLSTPSGRRLGEPDGQPARIQVNARPTGTWIYWVLGIVAGLVLVIGVYRSLRRGPRPMVESDRPEDHDASQHPRHESDDD